MSKALITHTWLRGAHGEIPMLKRHYLTAALVFLSLATGSAVASAAETGIKTTPIVHRYDPHPQSYGLYDYAGRQAGYGWYDYRWDPKTWSTGNGYY
jgi:hypothetical protein